MTETHDERGMAGARALLASSSKRTRFGRVFVEHLLTEHDDLREQLAAATARAEKAEARLADLGEPEVEQRMVSPSGLIDEPTLRDLENQAYWLPGVRLEERQVYPTPWRVTADAAQDGLSATETDAEPSKASGVELEFGKGTAGLSEPELCPSCGNRFESAMCRARRCWELGATIAERRAAIQDDDTSEDGQHG